MADRTFTHFIITRFNINFNNLYKTKYGADVRSDNWLAHRFEIFERYCLPSVQNQTEKDFMWLVFFDAATPGKFKSEIELYQQKYANFLPVYTASAEFFLAEIQNKISELATTPFVITSRLDNDDMLHMDFVKTIQHSFNSQPDCIINAPYGMQLDLEHSKTRLITCYNSFGPFVSLIERNISPRSVYFKQHKHWGNHENVIRINGRLWTQIIHSENVLNKFKEKRNYYLNLSGLTAFGVSDAIIDSFHHENEAKIVAHNALVPFYRLLFTVRKAASKAYRIMSPVKKN